MGYKFVTAQTESPHEISVSAALLRHLFSPHSEKFVSQLHPVPKISCRKGAISGSASHFFSDLPLSLQYGDNTVHLLYRGLFHIGFFNSSGPILLW